MWVCVAGCCSGRRDRRGGGWGCGWWQCRRLEVVEEGGEGGRDGWGEVSCMWYCCAPFWSSLGICGCVEWVGREGGVEREREGYAVR